MKYYIQDKLEELTEIAKNNPAVTVDFNHPSLVLFERVSTETQKSVIKLNTQPETGLAAVAAFIERLDNLLSYTTIVNDLGDTCYVNTIKEIVNRSYALVRADADSENLVEVIGPVRKLLSRPPNPDEVQPATQPITDAV